MSSNPPIIAVVDDDPSVLEALEDLLESARFSVRRYPSGVSLLEHDGFAGVDCLVADIGMPVVGGVELRRLAAEQRPELPVILITGRYETYRQLIAQQPGLSLFLKPFDGAALLSTISEVLRPKRDGDPHEP